MKELNYYWYHHGIPFQQRQLINQIILNHDFNAFIKYYIQYNSLGLQQGIYNEEFDRFIPCIYLPAEASYINEQGEIQYLNILTRSNFNLITHSECEHG